MASGIGNMIVRLREKTGFSSTELSQGVCSLPQITKIEHNQLRTDYFLLNRLLARLGQPIDRIECVVSKEIYHVIETRFFIQRAICYLNLEEAEERLDKFEKNKWANKKLHRQFIAQCRGQIAWIKGEKPEIVLGYLDYAIAETMPLEGAVQCGMALSAEELKLLLFRWEVSQKSKKKRPIEELREILSYRNLRKTDTAELAGWFPYLVLLLGMNVSEPQYLMELEILTKKALSLLRDEGRILFMPEILEQYVHFIKARGGNEDFAELLMHERKSLMMVEEYYGVHLEKFRLFRHTIRRLEIDSDLIRRERTAKAMTQEQLSEGICEPESLARIESGKRSPQEKRYDLFMLKMNRERKRINTVVLTDDYEVLWLKKRYNAMLKYQRYEEARNVLKKLEEYLDCSAIQNRQFLGAERTKIKYHFKEWSDEQCIEELTKQLALTMECSKNDVFEHELTVEEHSIINEMALIYAEGNNQEKGRELWRKQVQNLKDSNVYSVFHILEWELVIENFASILGDTKECSASICLCQEKMKIAMEAGKGNSLGRSLVTIAYAMEQEEKSTCVQIYDLALDLLLLYKMKHRYQCVVDYVFRPEFLFHEEAKKFHISPANNGITMNRTIK